MAERSSRTSKKPFRTGYKKYIQINVRVFYVNCVWLVFIHETNQMNLKLIILIISVIKYCHPNLTIICLHFSNYNHSLVPVSIYLFMKILNACLRKYRIVHFPIKLRKLVLIKNTLQSVLYFMLNTLMEVLKKLKNTLD